MVIRSRIRIGNAKMRRRQSIKIAVLGAAALLLLSVLGCSNCKAKTQATLNDQPEQTQVPVIMMTAAGTGTSTEGPTPKPTEEPTGAPTEEPTATPTEEPTATPRPKKSTGPDGSVTQGNWDADPTTPKPTEVPADENDSETPQPSEEPDDEWGEFIKL